MKTFTINSSISEVINYDKFRGFGHLIFPTEFAHNINSMKINQVSSLLPYHTSVSAEDTVNLINKMSRRVYSGETIFYDFYSKSDKESDQRKEKTGLFYFPGKSDAPFAVISAGGAFQYVGSIHESIPLADYVSEQGLNAFALVYRTGSSEIACQDLAKALNFIFDHAKELNVSTKGYSLWGGSAGAIMSAALGSYGTEAYYAKQIPRPGAVIMEYIGYSDYTKNDPPTFAVMGTADPYFNYKTLEKRINNLKALGIDAEFLRVPGAPHGFGLGKGTNAEGWIDKAIEFWKKQLK
ncbi:hypothetical protein TVAG_497250 [Trichomonas vaginalis G3]|uniref:Peptidase S9 prolyl oligopeptidase catalytic domain-containing protein n=1 Tax=Trichomonas vaginalis (strain ATCC PRA-98 / G3) TaxID=412133 RepID=A2EGW7_TRIV3|nr:acetylesterase protein [Trichomonas vaginalis G3]EAY08101.1 hypothetical protein TVAG_497250 [Trichomonas vaginalis G3]KAI5496684.1 acetylesterase protein [Trichomonas vaginalis G3]|eukprot:XP_001320324.1 hypothetical protein [Trichomonas vaginalis G3]